MRRVFLLAAIVCAGCASNTSGPTSAANDDQASPPKMDLPAGVKAK